ncbi:hypothetical protein HPG69_007627 [Diceros bicornis minor]|uniref:Uncharacterized protein n=1 Tax=Diceros bicornis minor TaxID=77932 RepID=A0A7J7EA76_DICBM|nr:hypothetical protein HPG69_007627 [Diceros bicornis minor]
MHSRTAELIVSPVLRIEAESTGLTYFHSFFPFSMAGGLRYSFLTLSSQLKPKQPVDEENIPQDLKG